MRLHESGKEHEVPCHRTLEEYLDPSVAAADIAGDSEGFLFRTLYQHNVYRMIQR